jgi:hypothetical protein
MTLPDPFNVTVDDTPMPSSAVVPNHRASQGDSPSTSDSPKRTPRERLMGAARGKKSTGDSGPPPLPRPKKPAPSYHKGKYTDKVEDVYSTVGMFLMPVKPSAAAYLLNPEIRIVTKDGAREEIEGPTGARRIAEAWDELAETNESVRRVLEFMTTGGVAMKLFMAHIPLVMAITADTKADPMVFLARKFGGADEQ